MAATASIGIYDILDKISQVSGVSSKSMTLDDTLDQYLSALDLVEVLSYLAAYHGYSTDMLLQELTVDSSIEDVYTWFMRRQDAAGLPAKSYAPSEESEALFASHQTLIRTHQTRWHLRESMAILEAVKQQREQAVAEKREGYAKAKKGCTSEALVITILLLIPAAIFLSGTAQKVVLGLLILHLLATVVLKMWGLNSEDCRKWENEIAQLQTKVDETAAQIRSLQSEISEAAD